MKRFVFTSLSLLLLAACGGGGSDDSLTSNPGSTSSRTSKFTLAISDAPVEQAQKVCIAVSSLRLKLATEPDDHIWTPLQFLPTPSEQDACLPAGYTVPLNSAGQPRFFYLDLLNYQDGKRHTLLSAVELTSGEYEQLRLLVEDGRKNSLEGTGLPEFPSSYVQDAQGKIFALEVPSSELKLHGFTAPADGVLSYQLEFNLRHAMVLPGHNKYYKLKPNGVRLLSVTTLTTLQGQVGETLCNGDLSQAGVYLYPARQGSTLAYGGLASSTTEGGPLATTLVQAATATTPASYALHYVEPGTYDVALICNARGDAVPDEGESSSFLPTLGSLAPGVTVNPALSNPLTVDLITPLLE